jgi:hypothetical protein
MGAERPVEFTAYKKSLLGRSRPSPEFKSVRFKSLAEPAHSSELTVMAIGLPLKFCGTFALDIPYLVAPRNDE